MTYGAPKSILSGTAIGMSAKKKKQHVKLSKKNKTKGKIMIKDDRLDVDYNDDFEFALPK